MKRMDQQQLIKAAKDGDRKPFEQLYSDYRDKLHFFVLKNVGSKEAAEDIVSEAFLDAMQNIGSLKAEEAFGSWLYSIAYRKCIHYNEENSHTAHFDSEEEQELAMSDFGLNEPIKLPEDYAVNRQRQEQIKEIIDGLSTEQRSAIILYYFEERSVGEVAKALNINEGAAKKRLFDARKKIKTKIEKLMKSGAFCLAPLGAVLQSSIDGKYAAGVIKAGAAVKGVSALKIAAAGAAAVVVVGSPVGLHLINNGSWGGEQILDSSSVVLNEKTESENDESLVKDREDNYPDKLTTTTESNSELIVVKIGDDLIDTSNGSWVHDLKLDGVADGQFVKVTADFTRQSGGVAGYMNDPFIKEVKSAEVMDTKEGFAASNIPLLDHTTPDILNKIVFYQYGSDNYLYVCDSSSTLHLFKNGEQLKQYENIGHITVPEVFALRKVEYENGESGLTIFDKSGMILSCSDKEIYALDSEELCERLADGRLDEKLKIEGQINLTELYDNYIKLIGIPENDMSAELVYPNEMPDAEAETITWYLNYCRQWDDMTTITIHKNERMTDIYTNNDSINDIYEWCDEAMIAGRYDEEG